MAKAIMETSKGTIHLELFVKHVRSAVEGLIPVGLKQRVIVPLLCKEG